MKQLSRLCLPLLAITLAFPAAAAKVYKWVDDEGVTHYTEQAPADKEYEIVSTSGAPPSGAAKAKKQLEEARAARDEKATKDLDFAEQQKIRDEEARIRKENCENAKANLKTMQEHARIRILGDDGEFRYLSEEEKQQQEDRAKQIISDNCDS